MPLSFAKAGDVCTVIRVGGAAKVRSHLENLGVTLGAAITVVQNTASGLIVNIRESRVAISTEMASKIFVK
jgi:ferrous iron transport protein A